MPKVGETPEMGANPMLGFGRVYARPELAKTVDRRVRRLLNEPGHTFEHFHEWLRAAASRCGARRWTRWRTPRASPTGSRPGR